MLIFKKLTIKIILIVTSPTLFNFEHNNMCVCGYYKQEPMKSRAPQLHLEYRFYKQLGQAGKLIIAVL